MSGRDFERLAGVLYERVRLPGSMKWDRVCMELPHLAADYRAGLLAVLREMREPSEVSVEAAHSSPAAVMEVGSVRERYTVRLTDEAVWSLQQAGIDALIAQAEQASEASARQGAAG